MRIMQSSLRSGRSSRVLAAALVLAALGVTGCGLENQAAPTMTGPSEFGLSVTLSATPDQLPRDGQSQSTVSISVRDPQGRPVTGQRLGLGVNGPQGTALSQAEVTTGSDGRATFTVTAPPQTGVGSSTVTVFATPIGSNSENATSRTVSIALSGVSNTSAPSPAFTFTPTAPEVNQVVTLDASTTRDEGAVCGSNCSYIWNFDDGSFGAGPVVTHRFSSARAHTVTLTVTDAAGLSVDLVQVVQVASVRPPTVVVVNTPDPALVNLSTVFTATATPALNHSITRYEWNFGDGTSEITTSASVVHVFTQVGRYVVTVTAFDDVGQSGIGAKSVTVTFAVDPPVANFVSAPTAPKVNDTVTFNASGSTVGAGGTITTYTWDFGNGSAPVTTTTPATQTVYAAQGTYIVTLTVNDNLGRQATRTATITVTP
jgi:PKD repeat protein